MRRSVGQILYCLATAVLSAASAAQTLEERFADPPETSRLQTWWHWCGDNVSERGIAADLAAMKALDIGVAHVFSARMTGPVPGYCAKLLSPEWKRLFAFAVAEAGRNGITLGFHNCPGWSSSGGPWIRPEDSMKRVVSAETDVADPSCPFTLPQPEARLGFYRDIAVFAVPRAAARPPADASGVNSSTSRYGYVPAPRPEEPGVPREAFVDLTGKVSADGSVPGGALPAGAWRVLRIGYTTTGSVCGPATLSGLECDKLSKRGLDAHWPHFPHELLAAPGAAETIRIGVIDSFEVGGQNWTESMPEEFRRRRGYDLTPYLPALVGYPVGTAGETAKFLFDFQRTVADLFAENYYDYFAELCHRDGIRAATEAYGGPFDPLRCFRSADVPTGEFWLGSDPQGTPRLAASAAHVNGRALVAAEAFTTEAKEGRWRITPHELRVNGDRGWLEGVSQLVFHSYVAQPFERVKPGLSLDRHGTQLNRNTTWWTEGAEWSRYVRRGQFLLQAGESVSEALVLTGDGRPCFYERPWQFVQAGYQFDFVGRDDFLRLEAAEDGVRTPAGAVYPILSLGSDRHLSLATLRKVKELLDGGVRVAGRRPLDTPSLADDPAEWSGLADAIWNGRRANLVEENWDPLVAARRFGIPPPVDSGERLGSRRLRIGNRDFFFVMNDRGEPFADEVVFTAVGAPSVWDAKSGAVTPLPFRVTAPGRVATRLSLPPYGSAFVGFDPSASREAADSGARPSDGASAPETVVAELSGDWTIVAFDGPCAPAAPLALARLVDWSAASDPKLRYFAGHATYERTLDLPSAAGPLVLDLGDVRDVATVSLDGRPLACLWEPPYRVRLPDGQSGRVKLRVTVVNTWPNRLIGDAIARRDGASEPKRDGYPAWVLADAPDSGTGIYTWSNFDWGWTADDALLPAGLIGPVRLLSASPGLAWRVPASYGRREDGVLTISVPQEDRDAWDTMARAPLDLGPFAGRGVDISVRCRGENLSKPPEPWLGLKVMLHLRHADGTESWPQAPGRDGTFDWTTLRFHYDVPDPAPAEASLSLGLQSASGTVAFDLSTLKIEPSEPIFTLTNRSYRVKYPDAVRSKPRLRGVMLPARPPTEADFRTLHDWGATLARFQMVRNWGVANDNRDLAEYDRWIDGKLDDLERLLPWAEASGIEIVVDLHVPPGGRDESNDMNMFYDARYADHFVETWKRIATRFRGRKGIYGYDLVNEPTQTRRALPGCDYWNLQRRAAEAVRAIDPTTPVIVEANEWDGPGAFAKLSPLAMDNVIYQVHVYVPHDFTHQGVGRDWKPAVWPDAEKGWTRDFIRKSLEPVVEFRRRHDARIYVGEFSAIAWGEGAADYLADCIAVFDEYGFDWTYHAFREWEGWSVEHEVAEPREARRIVPSADNPRKRALLAGFAERK